MPTYEYRCEKCKGQFDRLQKLADPPVAECPECGGRVRRVFGIGAVLTKGSSAPTCALDGNAPCGGDPSLCDFGECGD